MFFFYMMLIANTFSLILVLDAVRARFQISESHWNEFFKCCLHRTLTQMLYDVRRKYKREQEQNDL